MDSHRTRIVAFAQLSVGLLVAVPAHAAATKVNQSDWWGGVTGFPSYVNMYIYVPKSPATKPPIVVVPHHCGGDASSSYSENSGLVTKADSVGFILVYPEATGQNCWDAGSPRSMNHSGTGDVPAIAQMVKYTLAKYNGDAGRVYSVGGSSGGIVTEALLGVFPDVFAAGISIMGVPCGCWAEGYNDVTGKPSNGTGQWSGPCANGEVSKTGKAWGDLVRSYFPSYTGHRPRLQHWHGTSDTTLSYKNLAEDVKEWTNLLGLSETPAGSDSPKSGTTRQYWKNSCGYTVYETFSLSGVGHSVSVDSAAIATYFGLDDKATTEDPETKACGSAGTGSGGTGNTGGTASVGVSGAPGIAGRSNGQAGRGGLSLGGVSSIAGGPGTGGRDRSSGGAPATAGGTASTSQAMATGIGGNGRNTATGVGGSVGSGEPTAAGGRKNASAASNQTGGVTESSNATSIGGSVTRSSAATNRGGGSSSAPGTTEKSSNSSGVATTTGGNPNPDSGCSCVVIHSKHQTAISGILMLLALCGRTLRRKARGMLGARSRVASP